MPARLRDIKRELEARGIAVEEPQKGSHWKCRGAGRPVFPLAAHNALRTEIADVYIRALCKHFGIDFNEFMSKL